MLPLVDFVELVCLELCKVALESLDPDFDDVHMFGGHDILQILNGHPLLVRQRLVIVLLDEGIVSYRHNFRLEFWGGSRVTCSFSLGPCLSLEVLLLEHFDHASELEDGVVD